MSACGATAAHRPWDAPGRHPLLNGPGCQGATRVRELTKEHAAQAVIAARLPDPARATPGLAMTTGQSLARFERTKANGLGKRLVDLTVAATALLVTWPLLVVLGLMVRVSSPGPALFRQERIGRGMRPFTMFKLRTMVDGADRLVGGLLEESGADQRFYKFQDDPRVTGVGRWLRRWSLDELPQLWNVVRGDMSLAGPRPGLPSEVEAYENWQLARLAVRPGLTGAWQVSGRCELGFDDCVQLDLAYIEDWSLRTDLIILAKTVPAVLGRRGSW
jgi:lipopolysaccharide/colanic/teichoic acid biosynthesis glycosyltransferase